MNRRYKRDIKGSRLKEIVFEHVQTNIKEYLIMSIMLLIGIVLGVIFINNVSENQSLEITSYINSSIENLKSDKEINSLLLLKDSLKKNMLLAITLWFMGSTVIGISIVYLLICFRGFCLGYTVSSIIFTLGMRKRNNFLIVNYISTKYLIYTMYYGTCCKWNETT